MTRRLLTLSAFAAALFAVAAVGQPPAGGKGDKKADAPAPDTALEAALANDPDVRVARAKVQLAEAEWVKARQAVTAKVLTLRSQVADQTRAAQVTAEMYELASGAYKKGQGSRAELLAAAEKMYAAQAAVSRSETELKLITGGGAAGPAVAGCPFAGKPGGASCLACHAPAGTSDEVAAARIDQFRKVMTHARAATGPVPDRIRAALDKPVKLGAKGESVSFPKALDAFKKAGLDVPVRVLAGVGEVSPDGEELPIGAWLQLYADQTPDCLMLVRDYGLLVTGKTLNPPTDAVSVFDLWKQKPADPKK